MATAADPRLTELKDLGNDSDDAGKPLGDQFAFEPPSSLDEWEARKTAHVKQLLVANGLWPLPEDRPPVGATVHGRVKREGYTVDKVFLETSPGLYVTGSLYSPTTPVPAGGRPVIMCPHMHTPADSGSGGGRFHDCIADIEGYLVEGGEDFAVGGRHPLQARCVHLARSMGCIAFLYDMQGGRFAESEADPEACYGDGGSFNYDLVSQLQTPPHRHGIVERDCQKKKCHPFRGCRLAGSFFLDSVAILAPAVAVQDFVRRCVLDSICPE